MHAKILLTLSLAAIVLATGCTPPVAIIQKEKIGLAECIERHNANAGKVEQLWIHCDMDFQMHRPGKLPLKIGLDGLLIYRPPRELVLKGDILAGTQVFFGSNNQKYWMWSKQEDTLYEGTWKELGKSGGETMAMPAPEVFWMLGIYPIRGTPILSYTRDDRYRYIRFHDVVGGRQLRVLRELVIDRIDHWEQGGKVTQALGKDRVVAIRTYSLDGTPMVEATCGGYRSVTTAKGDAIIPTKFTIEVPRENITLKIELDENELAESFTHEIHDAYFKPRPAPVAWKVLLDEGKRIPNE